MNKIYITLISFIFAPAVAIAGANIVEGGAAQSQYDAEKAASKVLAQKDKKFILREGGSDTPKPKSMTLKVGEKLFIVNEEEKYTHNVYDSTDDSWVLQKQSPGGIAVISFDAPGEHKLRCAIHPKMKIKVKVE